MIVQAVRRSPRITVTGTRPAMDASFEEGKHPRAGNGQFGAGGGGGKSGTPQSVGTPAPGENVKAFAAQPTVWTSKASGIEYVTNAIPTVPKSELASARAQGEALEDAMVDENQDYFAMGTVDPKALKTLQNQVARQQVVDVASAGSFNSESNGEAPIVVKGPDGLILIDGNHRANAAILAGEPLRAQVFDYDKWKTDSDAKAEAKEAAARKTNSKDDEALLAELLA